VGTSPTKEPRKKSPEMTGHKKLQLRKLIFGRGLLIVVEGGEENTSFSSSAFRRKGGVRW